jgi:EAL domain-containing protein (putative c-di-GMP-specific phosphodiesterase class I)
MPVAIRYGVAFSHGNDDPVEFLHAAEPPERNDDGAPRAASQRPPLAPTVARLPTIAELQPAFSTGEVKAYAQAAIDPVSRDLVGYRGFAQWNHPEQGVLGPSIVEQMASDTALAPVLDLYVARETATLLVVAAREKPLAQYTTASRRLLEDIYTEQRLDEIATAYFLPMHRIHLLINATMLRSATTRLRDALRALADADLSLVLASLSDPHVAVEELLQLGFRGLEFSAQLIHEAASDPALRDVVTDLTDRAHRADLLVGANDISTPEQHDTLQQVRCDLASGDLYASKQLTETLIDE